MTDCEQVEVQLEMQAHGALDASRVGPLEAHLAQCPSCRRYRALLRESEASMSSHVVDLNRIEARIHTLQDERRARSWMAAAVPVALGLAVGVLSGHLARVLAIVIPVGLVPFAVIRLGLWAESRKSAALARTQADLLANYRSVLDRRIRRIRIISLAVPVLVLLSDSQWLVWHRWPASMARPAIFVVIGVVQVAAVVAALGLRWRKLPQLERERRELDRA
jgi:anti-sigma factor RsiW